MKKVFVKKVKKFTNKQQHLKQNWFKSKKNKLKIGVLLFVTFVIAASLSIWATVDTPLVSPIDSLTTFSFLSQSSLPTNNKKIVYGFLPYWNINKFTPQPELTHLGYFSLTIDASGNVIEYYDGGEVDMGLRRLNSDEFLEIGNDLLAQDKQVEVVITSFNHGDIVAFLSSQSAQENFFTSLDSVLLAYPISGVNIDFETSKETSQTVRDNFTKFMERLREHLDNKYGNMQVSIDMYAGAATNQQLWDVAGIEPYVDHIIVMAYDFHRTNSQRAGPVAPLFGDASQWESSINRYLQDFLAIVPAKKVVLGLPFYGYEWQTTSRDSTSHTFPDTGATASYSRVLDLLEKKEELQVQEHWNETALSPYISYIEDGEIYVVYYENSRSLSYKLDYANQLDLGGIAIWALGYEGDSRELWDVIQRKINIKQP